jgi:hypothetical protein
MYFDRENIYTDRAKVNFEKKGLRRTGSNLLVTQKSLGERA